MWLSLLARFWYAPIMLCLFLWGEWWHHEAKDVKKDLDVLTVKVEANGKIAEANAKLKEAEYDKNLSAATAGRDDALKRLQLAKAEANSAGRRVSSNPAAPAGSSKVCFNSPAYDAAFKRFGERLNTVLQGITGLAYQGDAANIDAKALIDAWPK